MTTPTCRPGHHQPGCGMAQPCRPEPIECPQGDNPDRCGCHTIAGPALHCATCRPEDAPPYPCRCDAPDRMAETPDDAADCAYCGGRVARA